jgi:signal transduction histidine kinase
VVAGAPGSVRVRCRGTARYPFATEAAVYYSVLEATQNALKHAGAGAHLKLSLECADTGVSFRLSDDGRGFDVERRSNGMGMVSMRDRMSAVGGALSVSSTPSGTTVTGHAPARRSDDKAGS